MITRSVRHRLTRRRVVPWVWAYEPIISPYADKLRLAAFGDHECRPFIVLLDAGAIETKAA